MIILDTNVVVEILGKRSIKGEQLYSALIESGETISTTAINLHEVMYGLRKYSQDFN